MWMGLFHIALSLKHYPYYNTEYIHYYNMDYYLSPRHGSAAAPLQSCHPSARGLTRNVAGSYTTKLDTWAKLRGWAIQLSGVYSIVTTHVNVCDPWENLSLLPNSDCYFSSKGNGKIWIMVWCSSVCNGFYSESGRLEWLCDVTFYTLQVKEFQAYLALLTWESRMELLYRTAYSTGLLEHSLLFLLSFFFFCQFTFHF